MAQRFELNGKVVVITGGTGLLGSAYAQALAEHGAQVVMADLAAADPAGKAAAIRTPAGAAAVGIDCDVGVEAEVIGLFEQVMARFGRVDVVLNNAAATGEHLMRQGAVFTSFEESTLAEVEFLRELVQRSGCGLLLDLNNLYVNGVNHGIDPLTFLEALPAQAIGEIHLAGHTPTVVDGETVLIDTHGSAVCDAVWALYRECLQRFGPRPTLIEWDTDVPPLAILLAEAAKADRLVDECMATECQATTPASAAMP